MNYCPCCSHILLQHIRTSEVYWFCRHCWQEMPVWEGNSSSLSEEVMENLPTILHHQNKASANSFTSNFASSK